MKVFEIGSEYDWNSNAYFWKTVNNGESFNDNFSTFKFLRSGRDALRFIAKALSPVKKTVFMPALCCSCMPEPFLDENYEIIYYKLTSDFKVNIEDVLSKLKPNSIFLFMNYFAIPSLNKDDLEKIARFQNGVTTIEDITHDFLKRGIETFDADITVCSIRKWFAIPDGGMLFSKVNLPEITIEQDTFFADKRISAMKRKSMYLLNGEMEEKNQFRAELTEANQYIDTVKNIGAMDDKSMNFIKHIDLAHMYKIRLKHCIYLYDKLSGLNGMRLIGRESSESTLYLPILVEQQSDVQKKLAERGIYAPVIWPLPELAQGVCKIADDVANHMLGIPCDHRYTHEEIKKMVQIITEVM